MPFLPPYLSLCLALCFCSVSLRSLSLSRGSCTVPALHSDEQSTRELGSKKQEAEATAAASAATVVLRFARRERKRKTYSRRKARSGGESRSNAQHSTRVRQGSSARGTDGKGPENQVAEQTGAGKSEGCERRELSLADQSEGESGGRLRDRRSLSQPHSSPETNGTMEHQATAAHTQQMRA